MLLLQLSVSGKSDASAENKVSKLGTEEIQYFLALLTESSNVLPRLGTQGKRTNIKTNHKTKKFFPLTPNCFIADQTVATLAAVF